MTLADPKLILTFLENDLAPGHETTQTLGDTELVRYSFTFKKQRFNGLKSSSDTVSLKIVRKCSATEDIIATEGDIKAVLKDGDETLFTGYVSTSFSWSVTDHGEQVLNITLESVGTRLFNKAFIETGKYFFDCPASTAVYNIIHPLGITFHSGDERKLLQNVQKLVDAGTTCRELMDQLVYECNAVYYFNNLGELCIQEISADTTGAQTYDSNNLRMKDKKVVSLSKKLRTYKGARVAYDEVSSATDYLIYRNTTNADTRHPYCNMEIPGGYYFDGADFYTAAEWSEATADEFREPTLISAVNAASESTIVGSSEIFNISNLRIEVQKDPAIDFSAEIVGGPYFKLLAHNTAEYNRYVTRMDLYADIAYVKSHGVIRTQIDGASEGKSMLEEDLEWIHDRNNASKHANLLAQYHRSAGASYTFYSHEDIALGSVIKLNDDVYSGLEVYVLVTATQYNDKDDCYTYTAVGITTFDLSESAYHGTTEPAKQSGAQGPAGEPGATAEIQYALGTSLTDPPGDAMQWASADMLWGGDTMFWNSGTWESDVPETERGKYIWMRTRIGEETWQYSRLTGSTAWDPQFLGLCDSSTGVPTQTPDGLGIIVGDCFTALESWDIYSKGVTYTYTGAGWAPIGTDNPTMLLEALSAMKEAQVDFKDLNDPNTISWFNTMIADEVIGRVIKGISGIFENITVSGQSIFLGQVQNDALTTFGASDPDTYSGSLGSSWKLVQPIILWRQYLPTAQVASVFGGDAMSVRMTGTLTMSDGTTYTGTSADPFVVLYNPQETLKITGGTLTDNLEFRYDTVRTYPTWGSDVYEDLQGYWTLNNVSSLSPNTNPIITSVSLATVASLGGFYAHDILPKSSATDKIGSATEPFAELWLGSSTIAQNAGESVLPNGLKIKWGRKSVSTTGTVSIDFTNEGLSDFSLWQNTFVTYAASSNVGTQVSLMPEYNYTTGVTVHVNASSSTLNGYINWFAIGI